MKKSCTGARLLWMLSFAFGLHAQTVPADIRTPLNQDWTFHTKKYPTPFHIDIPFYYVHKASSGLFVIDTENGPWKITEGFPENYYEKVFSIPETYRGKRILLRFEGVNYLSNIILNGVRIHTHAGGYLAFEVDITDHIEQYADNKLRVSILYQDPRFINPNGYVLWPVGFNGHNWHLGMVRGVELVARSPVYIDDVFVRTSVRRSAIAFETTVVNSDTIAHTLAVSNSVAENPSIQVLSDPFTLQAGEKRTVSAEIPWNDPEMWSIENPRLYHAVSLIMEGDVVLHEKTEPFGFREFWISGDRYFLNGVPINLRGDNFIQHGENHLHKYLVLDENNFSAILDTLKAYHCNSVRFGAGPPPQWMLDLCDRKGLYVLCGSAVSSKGPERGDLNFLANAKTWIAEWVRQYRNHPSILGWVAENEQWYYEHKLTIDQAYELGQAIAAVDSTRIIQYDGDFDLNGRAGVYSIHYPFGFTTTLFPGKTTYWPTEGMFAKLAAFRHAEKPTSWCEFEWARDGDRHIWVKRQALIVQFGRMMGISEIRPYRLDWFWHPNLDYTKLMYEWTPSAADRKWISDAMNPVAAFDKMYYNYSVFPDPPSYKEWATAGRPFVVFNDEASGSSVEVHSYFVINGDTLNRNRLTLEISASGRKEIVLPFQAPFVSKDSVVALHAATFKNGRRKYEALYPLLIKDQGLHYPRRVAAVHFSPGVSSNTLEWNPVLLNEEGKSALIAGYQVIRSPDPLFSPGAADTLSNIPVPRYTDAMASKTRPCFYRIITVDSRGIQSKPSDTFGYIEYTLDTTSTTNFNQIALPVRGYADIGKASRLMALVPGCNSLAAWEAAGQGYRQYLPDLPQTDFDTEPGQGFLANVVLPGSFFWEGIWKPVPYQLAGSEVSSSWNLIMHPFEKRHLMTASDLLSDVPGCNGVARWDSRTQAFSEQYVPDSSLTSDFGLTPGHACFVSVSSDVVWPGNGIPRKIPPPERKAPTKWHGPHLVWGPLPETPKFERFEAFVYGNEEEILTQNHPGCGLDCSTFRIQCGNFSRGWGPGDTLIVRFRHDGSLLEQRFALDARPDQKVNIRVTQWTEYETAGREDQAILLCHPNPSNGSVTISYRIPESGAAELRLFDIKGRMIRSWSPENPNPGWNAVVWDGRDETGLVVPSGTYLVRIRVAGLYLTRKIVFLQ